MDLSAMVGGCPWGQPLRQWTMTQLRNGRDECARPGGEAPNLGAAIAAEIRRRMH